MFNHGSFITGGGGGIRHYENNNNFLNTKNLFSHFLWRFTTRF